MQHISRKLISDIIIWLAPRAGKMNQILRCDWLPEWARWRYLARSRLPPLSCKKNFPKSHMIILYWPSLFRWLDIGLVLFLRVYGPRLRLGSINTQKENFSDIQPSWPNKLAQKPIHILTLGLQTRTSNHIINNYPAKSRGISSDT